MVTITFLLDVVMKNVFEWTTNQVINHSEHAVMITETAANFFVSEGECPTLLHTSTNVPSDNKGFSFVYFVSCPTLQSLHCEFIVHFAMCFTCVHGQVLYEWWMTCLNSNPSIASLVSSPFPSSHSVLPLPPLHPLLLLPSLSYSLLHPSTPFSPLCSAQELPPVPFRGGRWEVADLQLKPGLQWEAGERLWTGLPLCRINLVKVEQWPLTHDCQEPFYWTILFTVCDFAELLTSCHR